MTQFLKLFFLLKKGDPVNPLAPRDAVRKRKKNILEDLFSSVLSRLKKYHPSENVKFNNLDSSQSLKLRILMEKILPTALKLNFTPNSSGGYELSLKNNKSDLLNMEK